MRHISQEQLQAIRTLTLPHACCTQCGQNVGQAHIAREYRLSQTVVSRIKDGYYDKYMTEAYQAFLRQADQLDRVRLENVGDPDRMAVAL